MEGQQFVPMSATRIIDRVFFFYSRNFIKFITMVAVIFIPVGVLSSLLTIQSTKYIYSGEGLNNGLVMAMSLGASLLTMIGTVISSGILAQGFSELYLGKKIETGSVFGVVLPKLGSMLGAGIVSTIIILIGYCLFVVPGIIFGLWYSMISVVIVLEGIGGMKSLGRSKELAKGNLGKIFGTLFLAGLIAAVINWAIVGAFNMIMGVGMAASSDALSGASNMYLILAQVFNTVSTIIVTPITAGTIVLIYYDLRIRKEGFDLEMLAKNMDVQPEYATVTEQTDFTE